MFIIIAVIQTLLAILKIIDWALIIYVAAGWLINFNVLNPSNTFVHTLYGFLCKLFDTILYRIRSYLPNSGSIDFSPLVLWIGLFFLEALLAGALVSTFFYK